MGDAGLDDKGSTTRSREAAADTRAERTPLFPPPHVPVASVASRREPAADTGRGWCCLMWFLLPVN